MSRVVFEIKPHLGGWKCHETPGVKPYVIGLGAEESASLYAKGRTALRVG